jgi:hypothetical protein
LEICKRFEKNPNPNPNPNTQQIENPDLNLWVLLGAYVWPHKRIEREIKRFLKISFFDGAG